MQSRCYFCHENSSGNLPFCSYITKSHTYHNIILSFLHGRRTRHRWVLTLDIVAYRAGLLLGRVRQRLDALQDRVSRLGRTGRSANGPVARLLLLLELQSHVRSFGRGRGGLRTRRFGRVLPLLGSLLRLRPGRRRPVGGSHRWIGIVCFRG